MKVNEAYVYLANNVPTTPICVSMDETSFCIWIAPNGEVVGVLKHDYNENNEIISVYGAGSIPAKYVAYEENARNYFLKEETK